MKASLAVGVGIVLLAAGAVGCGTTAPLVEQQRLGQLANGSVAPGGTVSNDNPSGAFPTRGNGAPDAGSQGSLVLGSSGPGSADAQDRTSVDGQNRPGAGVSPSRGTDGRAAAATRRSAGAGATTAQGIAAGRNPGGANAPGVTATTVTIGVTYTVNAGAANSAFGGNGITNGNEESDANAVIVDINSRGGLLGHKVSPLFYPRDAQSSQTASAQAQAECTFYTQDHSVFAVLIGNGPVDWAEKPCLNHAGIPTITSHIVSLDDGDPALPLSSDAAGMDVSGQARSLLAALAAQNWYAPWNATTGSATGATATKVGLVEYAIPAVENSVTTLVLPGMAKAGHPVDPKDVFQIPVPQSTADVTPAETALSNAVLQMRSDGVDHVAIIDQGGAMTLLLSNDLYSQEYFPRLAGTSSNGFQALLSGGDIQAKSLEGLVGSGWEPVLDLPYSDSGMSMADSGAARPKCLALLQRAGESFSNSDAEATGLGYCDKVGVFADAVTSGGALTESAYRTGLDRIGPFDSARGAGSTFAAGHHDAASAYFDMVYSDACGCVSYAGGRQTL